MSRRVAFKERLGVFPLLPVFSWISIKRCERSHFPPSPLPLLLPHAVTNRQMCAVFAHAAATPAEKGWWSGLTRYAHKHDLPSPWLQKRAADVGVTRAAARRRESSPETQSATRTQRTGGCAEDAAGPGLMRALGLQLLPQVYGLLYARPSSTICFLGNQRPSRATSTQTRCSPDH